MNNAWYYADQQQQQQGPVAAEWFAAGLGRGIVNANTLVWREGLPDWAPLAQFAAELGLALSPTPPTPPLLPRAMPVVGKSASSGAVWAIVIVGVVVVGIFMLAILAAIALPAYQDYTVRAKVSNALVRGYGLKPAVEEFVSAEQRCPSNTDAGFRGAESYADAQIAAIHFGQLQSGDCAIQLLLKDFGATAGKELLYARDAEGEWTVTSTLANKYLPASMRKP